MSTSFRSSATPAEEQVPATSAPTTAALEVSLPSEAITQYKWAEHLCFMHSTSSISPGIFSAGGHGDENELVTAA